MSVPLSATLQSAYDEQYSDRMTMWRELGGKFKSSNIQTVCATQSFHNVLDCGAGEGGVLHHLDRSHAFPNIYAIEISDSGIAQIQKRNLQHVREVKKFDGYTIPYPDKFFDLSICSHVIEHVEHPRLLLRELKRVSHFQVFEIPLDYGIGVDRQSELLLSYGHINVYTPSLFRFLLRTEGYMIHREHYSQSDPAVLRFNWYRNQNLKWKWKRELKLSLRPILNKFKRWRSGSAGFQEFNFHAYTCLAEGVSELKILG